MPLTPDLLRARAGRVRLLLVDVDGVLTDGSILLGTGGLELKGFFVRDGTGLVLARRAGLRVGLLSGRSSETTTRRATELGIDLVMQGEADKSAALDRILAAEGVEADETAYMGDDVLDLPVLSRVGLSAAPADAVPEVLATAHWVSRRAGGKGAVRDLIEFVLGVQGRWPDAAGAHGAR